MSTLRRTPLYAVQAELGARFVPFAGYEMPVQFSGVLKEHEAVRTHVGLFDVSHMGEVLISGPGALEALQHIVTNDVSTLHDGGAQYTVMCYEHGGIIDDLIIYREAADRYFLCINASRRSEDVSHINEHAKGFDCTVRDVSDEYAQLALQGPKALDLLAQVSALGANSMKPFTFVDTQVAGAPNVRVARTGYTGEAGVELYLKNNDANGVYRMLLEKGAEFGLLPCGLASRDSLRLEMKYPLYGNDIDAHHNPLEAGLGWVVKLNKDDFVGKQALLALKESGGPARKWVGFKMLERGIPRQGYGILDEAGGSVIGEVTSGTHSPSLGEPIGTGYVPTELSKPGARLAIDIRGKHVPAQVCATPFYKREVK